MQELRFVAVSEDGSYAVLAVPGRSARFTLPIDERLRAVAQGHTSRLAQYEIEVESPLRPKEIQARIRAGETVEEIADAAGIAVERVRWFEGPVLAERAYVAQQAQASSVRRQGDSAPGPRLGDVVPDRLTTAGADPDEAQWDSRKRNDGSWLVQLTFPSGGRLHTAEWVFDPRRRHVMPADDIAARLSLPESELPPPPATVPGEATVTPLAPRLGAASAAGGQGGRLRQDRPVPAQIPVPAHAPGPAPAPVPARTPEPARAPWATPEPELASGLEDADADEPAREPAPETTPREAPTPPETTPPETMPPETMPREAPAPREASAVGRHQMAPPVHEPAIEPEQESASVTAATVAAAAERARLAADAAPAQAETAERDPGTPAEQPARGRRKSARGRRSSVPSWDEIMLGSSRENE